MAYYQFKCEACPEAPVADGVHADAVFDRAYPMVKAPALGRKIKCPCCGRRSAARILTDQVAIIVKGTKHPTAGTTETIQTRVNGQDVRFSFIDHKHTDPEYQRDLSALAKRQGLSGVSRTGLKNARLDEKSGRMVVDVASNVPDPLGMIERDKRSGNYTQANKKVNTPYKTRARARKAKAR